MAEEEKQRGPCPANDNGSPNGVSLDPRILRIACATRKKIAKRETFFRRSFMAKFMERNRNLHAA